MTNIAFRVDGGMDIGMGHIMRSLALANAFPQEIDVSFIVKEEEIVLNLLTDYNFEVITIDNNLDYENEVREVKDLVTRNSVDILITDSYEIKQNYLIEMKEVVDKLITIHDFASFAFPSDLVINGNIYAPELDYESIDDNTRFLLGPDYTLMREEFQDLSERRINKEVKNILVTVGGSDLLNLTPKLLKALNRMDNQNLHIDVVIGSGFDNIEDIIREVKKSRLEIDLHFNVRKMSELMLASDLAISASGSTLYELAATGTPAITLLQADNQVLVAEAMEEAGAVKNLGFGDEVEIGELKDSICRLMTDFGLRKKMSKRGQQVVDGRGVARIVEFILEQ